MEIYELKIKEQLVKIISSFAALILIISFGMFMLFFLGFALGYYLNIIFNSGFIGFVFIGVTYLLICIVLLVFKDKIITNHLFQAFFGDTLTQNKEGNHDENSSEQD